MARTRNVANTLDEAEEFIRLRKVFRLKGMGKPTLWATADPPSHLGLLPPRYSESIALADYVVMSYKTPIGWEVEGDFCIPDVGYSPTTGQHQYLTAHAWGLEFRPQRGRDIAPPPREDTLYGRARRLRRGGIDGEPGHSYGDDLARAREREAGWAQPDDPHRYSDGDAMHWNPTRMEEQDRLMEEVHGYRPAHP